MKFYNNLNDFVVAARDNSQRAVSAHSFSSVRSEGMFKNSIANSASLELPKEGLSAILTGHHLYAMLQLRPGLTTSSSNEDRRKNISLLAELVQGAREVSHRYDGALLEAQGPVVHIFIPDDNGTPRDVRKAAMEVQEFINDRIKGKAGTDFLKAVVAYSHGPTILVNAEDSHGDESIVSLAPAANAPAKVLWKKWEDFKSGSILEVELDGTYYEVTDSDRELEIDKSAGMIFNASRSLKDVMLVEASATQRGMPMPDSPDSPTVEDPLQSFSVSFRADIEGFTKKVSRAFTAGEDAVHELAQEFYEIMTYARTFCGDKECIHLPWAGDCFNLLLSFENREGYQKVRRRRILNVSLAFTAHMEKKFPDLEWSFSMAGGDLESAQSCNTLVSRITVGHTTLLLATGLPVERSLQGLVRESPDHGKGVVWKGDVSQLDSDLRAIMEDANGGENYRHFSLYDLEVAQESYDFIPAPAPYKSSAVPLTLAAMVPAVKPYYFE